MHIKAQLNELTSKGRIFMVKELLPTAREGNVFQKPVSVILFMDGGGLPSVGSVFWGMFAY